MNPITNLVVALMVVTQCDKCKSGTTTNFVYSSTIPSESLRIPCRYNGCRDYIRLKPEDMLGCEVERMWFYFDKRDICLKHYLR